jgi:UDP-N-acetylglucosamine--N-acetylmuramyl-(pentapeptide) pyrophosphoryl-undecaprenol N-acetylglucosamine transferase
VTLERAGAAIHVPQAQLTVERLDGTIRRLLENRAELERLARGAGDRARPNAADDIARRILALLSR